MSKAINTKDRIEKTKSKIKDNESKMLQILATANTDESRREWMKLKYKTLKLYENLESDY